MSSYQQQISCPADELDMDFWKQPTGVAVPDDELNFLLIPDAVETLATCEISRQVHRYQREQLPTGHLITRAA